MSDAILRDIDQTAEFTYTSKERNLVISAAALGWGLEFFDLMLVALMAKEISADFGVSMTELGVVFTVQLICTAIGGVIFGRLADIYGRRRVLSWTIWVFGLATAVTALTHSFTLFMVLRGIAGIGIGGEWAVGYALLNEAWSPKRRGLAGGLVQSAIWPTFALAIFVTGAVPNWRWAFAIGALPVLAAIWIRRVCPESKQWLAMRRDTTSGKLRRSGGSVSELFSGPNLKLIVIGTIVVFGAQYSYYVFSSWMPTYLKSTLGISPGSAQLILYASSAISMFSYILVGWLGDLIGRRNALLLSAAVQLLGFIAFASLSMTGQAVDLIVAAYFLISLGLGYYAIFGAWFGELFATSVRAGASGFCYSVGRGVASFGPYLVGAMSTKYGLQGGISTGMGSVLVMMVFACLLADRSGRVITASE